MSGHSKWSTIKRKKASLDAKRGKLFTRLLREVTVAAREGGGDPAGNPRLRAAIQEAKANNVPNDTVDRAIKKGTGELEGAAFEEVTYEGYGPGGAAVFVEAMTDNRNRTVSEVRHLFSRYGGNLGENGCVSWMFDRRGQFMIERDAMDEEAFMDLAIELGVEDISTSDDGYEILTSVADYNGVREALEEREVPLALGELAMIPQSPMSVEESVMPQVSSLLEALEDQDDVQNVWTNCNVDVSDQENPAG